MLDPDATLRSEETAPATSPEARLERLIAACDRFEAAWARGDRPRIEEHVAIAEEGDRDAVLKELLAVECELRRASGDRPEPDDYLRRFPLQSTLIASEFAGSGGAGPGLNPEVSRRFHILRPHAQGGLGRVLVALDSELGREVALKEIHPDLADYPESRARFLLEAEVTGKLEHPGVVPVYGCGNDASGRPYYAMKLVRGQSLQDAISAHHGGRGTDQDARALEFRRLLGRFVAVCEAIAYAHSRGVLHRDIKPANVMLGDFGETLVVDWGLAKVADREDTIAPFFPGDRTFLSVRSDPDATVPGRAMGTPAYMSPEQAAGDAGRVGTASDIYSLGATLYALLTGRSPTFGSDPTQILRRILDGTFPRPREVVRDVPRGLEAVCLKAMATRPDDRYPSAQAMADDLERWLAGESVSARREGLAERSTRWLRRHRAWAAAGLSALMIVSVVAVVAVLRIDFERRRADSGRDDASRQAARLAFDRAWISHDQGDAGGGLLWLSRSLELTGEDAPRERQGILATMNAWRRLIARRRLEIEHLSGIAGVAVSRDGRTIWSGADGQIRRWDATDGRPVGLPLRHPGTISDLALSPDGTRLASASSDGKVRVWDVEGGRQVAELPTGRSPVRLAFHPGGKTIATGLVDGTIQIWDIAESRSLTGPLKVTGPVRSLVFPPDGRALLATSREKMVRSWDCDGRPLPPSTISDGLIEIVAVAPDGVRMAVGYSDGSIRILDRGGSASVSCSYRHRGPIRSLCFSPDGHRILSASEDTTAQVWDAGTGRAVGEVLRHGSLILSAAFGPDGTTAVTGSGDHLLRLWELPEGPVTGLRLAHSAAVHPIAVSRDGRLVATGGNDRTARVWESAGGRPIVPPLTHKSPVRAIAFRPDGRVLATGSDDGSAFLWDLADGRTVGTPLAHRRRVQCVDFRPDGTLVATGGFDGKVRLWSALDGKPHGAALDHPGNVTSLRFSPDGQALASGDSLGAVRIWDPESGTLRHRIAHKESIRSLVFSPDGRFLATASNDHTARIWDVSTGQPVSRTMTHAGQVFAVAFRPDGRALATGGFDGAIRLWTAPEGTPTGEVGRADGPLVSLSFNASGTLLAAASHDGTVRLRDAFDGRALGEPFRHNSGVWSVAFLPNGASLLSGATDATGRLWSLDPPLPAPADDRNLGRWAVLTTQRTLGGGDSVEPLSLAEWRALRPSFVSGPSTGVSPINRIPSTR